MQSSAYAAVSTVSAVVRTGGNENQGIGNAAFGSVSSIPMSFPLPHGFAELNAIESSENSL